MRFNSYAHIFVMPEFDPTTNVVTMEKGNCRFKAVGVDMSHPEQAIEVAKQLKEEGYQIIDLCGGFGADWICKVKEALNGSIPIGGAFYGPEFHEALVDLCKED